MEIETEEVEVSVNSDSSLTTVVQFIQKHPKKAAVFLLSLISGLIVGWTNGSSVK